MKCTIRVRFVANTANTGCLMLRNYSGLAAINEIYPVLQQTESEFYLVFLSSGIVHAYQLHILTRKVHNRLHITMD